MEKDEEPRSVGRFPKIYAYVSLSDPDLKGWTKIGYTQGEVDKRISEQVRTSQHRIEKKWDLPAVFDDTLEIFSDTDFHSYLQNLGYERLFDRQTGKKTEYFKIDPEDALRCLRRFKERERDGICPPPPRKEQREAVEKTLRYFCRHGAGGSFLWNAKPRFGKTRTAYDLCREMGAKKILVVTNRPVIANSWYDDYVLYLGPKEYWFVSDVKDLEDKKKYPRCLTRKEYTKKIRDLTGNERYEADKAKGVIEFVSLQDLKGAKAFGGEFDKLSQIAELDYDILIVDESHEAVDTSKTRVAFKHISRKHTLYLSGTPFKALAGGQFPEGAIFNWTYADEQKAKRDWEGPGCNPYAECPQMNMYAYSASSMAVPQMTGGAVDGDKFDWACDLGELFKTKRVEKGVAFEHDSAVDSFLDALSRDGKYPFGNPEMREKIRHTLWLLDRVDSAKAMAEKLKQNEFFRQYGVAVAAGTPEKEEDGKTIKKSLEKVEKVIKNHRQSITLSVGQLTTGVTVPEWSGVMMLSNLSSSQNRPEKYVQAMFRAQTPYCVPALDSLPNGKRVVQINKPDAFVFDFDAARALRVYDAFANDLASHSPAEPPEDRRKNSEKLLRYFPVWGESPKGGMETLDPSQILSFPAKIEGRKAVELGFKYNGLFQNIGLVLQSPAASDVLSKTKAGKPEEEARGGEADFSDLDPQGNVIPSRKAVKEIKERVFGSSSDLTMELLQTPTMKEMPKESRNAASFVGKFISNPVVEAAKKKTQVLDPFKSKFKKEMEREFAPKFEELAADFKIQESRLESERGNKLGLAGSLQERARINEAYDRKLDDLNKGQEEATKKLIRTGQESAMEKMCEELNRRDGESKCKPYIERAKKELRTFASSVPAFLMAYGTYGENGESSTTLENLEENIPEKVFAELTGISKKDFKTLRDGGEIVDDRSGESQSFPGHVFNSETFNAGIKEFMRLRKELANYFDDKGDRDIFSYIPPQERNQIFTPKDVVRRMADLFEKENPGCFADPDHTFADLYMKSGLFIAEVVKRLYRNPEMKRLFPDGKGRLDHIFSAQVFGMAPTEITYKIALNFIFGFTGDERLLKRYESHFAMEDAAKLAREGSLPRRVEELFGEFLAPSCAR